MSDPLVPVKVAGRCVASDDDLFANMDRAIARGYAEVSAMAPERMGSIIVAASGPSIRHQVETIRQLHDAGTPIVAVRGAHDFLIEHGIIPNYAVTIDPLPTSWTCFSRKHPSVHYMIASQCPDEVFDHLEGCQVTLFHCYIKAGQNHPANRQLIGGGTTSGLRAITLFYVLGWRHFALFGFDSCTQNGTLRIDGSGPREKDQVIPIKLKPDGEVFYCNPAMAQQADHFQDYYQQLPGIHFYPYGDGLIPAIIRERDRQLLELTTLKDRNHERNDRVSFIHQGPPFLASYRYRAAIPAAAIGAAVNDLTANVLIFSKPRPQELIEMARCRVRGGFIVTDFCDDHFDWMHYQEALRLADVVTCSTEGLATIIAKFGRQAVVIPDPYEFPELQPHVTGCRLLWFGHSLNRYSLERVLPDLKDYPLRIVSDAPGDIPWSMERMAAEFPKADIVILPATESYKSANRAVEAIRQGCFVVAEPHPAWNDIPGIWIGNIREGVEWTKQHQSEANRRVSLSQSHVKEKYAPKTLASAWKRIIQSRTISAAALFTGTAG